MEKYYEILNEFEQKKNNIKDIILEDKDIYNNIEKEVNELEKLISNIKSKLILMRKDEKIITCKSDLIRKKIVKYLTITFFAIIFSILIAYGICYFSNIFPLVFVAAKNIILLGILLDFAITSISILPILIKSKNINIEDLKAKIKDVSEQLNENLINLQLKNSQLAYYQKKIKILEESLKSCEKDEKKLFEYYLPYYNKQIINPAETTKKLQLKKEINLD